MGGKWYADYVDLSTCAFGVTNRHSTWVLPARRGENATVPSRDGTIWSGDKPFDENEFGLDMFAAGADPDGRMPNTEQRRVFVRQNLDKLSRIFGSGKLIDLAYVEDPTQPYGRRNDIANPSFEAASGVVTVAENLINNPSGEASTRTIAVRRNHAPNSGFDSSSADFPYRRNLVRNPRMASVGSIVVRDTNRCPNPSFETDLSRWSGMGTAKISRVSNKFSSSIGWPVSGRHSMKVVATGAGYMAACGPINGIQAGTTYTLAASFWNGAAAGRAPQVRIQWRDKLGTAISNNSFVAASVATAAGTRLVLTATAPTGAKVAYIRVGASDGAASDAQYWDAVYFGLDATGTYFDGETDEIDGLLHRWVGEDGISRSEAYTQAPQGYSPAGSLAVTTANKMNGAQGVRAWLGASVADGGLLMGQTPRTGCVAKNGDVVTGLVHVMCGPASSGKSVKVQIMCYDSSGNALGVTTVTKGGAALAPTVSDLSENTWTAINTPGGYCRPKTATACIQVLVSGTTWTTADYAYFDEFMVEPATQAGDWFDGTLPDTDAFDYQWVGDPHWSESQVVAAALDSWTVDAGFQYQVDGGVTGGDVCMRVEPPRDPTLPVTISASMQKIAGNRFYRGSIYVNPSRTQNFKTLITIDGTQTAATLVSCTAGVWTRLDQAILVPTSASEVDFGLQAPTPADSDTFDVDGALFEATTVLRTYFDGNSGDLYEWDGPEESSSSIALDDDADGWAPYGDGRPAVSRTADQTNLGTHSVAATPAYDGQAGITSGRDVVDPDFVYSFGIDIRSPSLHLARVGLRWLDAAGALISDSTSDLSISANTWTRVSINSAVPPAGAAVVTPYATLVDADADEVAYFDRAIFGFGSSSVYADGDTAGWEWLKSGESRRTAARLVSWQASDSVIMSQSTTWASDRTHSGLVVVEGLGLPQRVTAVGPDDTGYYKYFPMESDDSVTFAIDVRGREAGQVRLALIPYTWDGFQMHASTDAVAYGSKVAVGAGAVVRPKLTATFTTATTHYLAAVDIFDSAGGDADVNQGLYLDSAISGRGIWNGSYFDGETDLAHWEGDADDSTSRFIGDARVASCEVRDAVDVSSSGYGTHAQFTVKLRAPEVFFRDQYPQEFTCAIARSGRVSSLFGLRGGTAPIGDAVVRINGPLKNPKITDVGSGSWVRIERRIHDGDYIEIDNGEWTVKNQDGHSVIVDVSHGGSAILLPITPVSGQSTPQVIVEAGSIGGGSSLKVTARRRYFLA